ncbi:hypothetical protein ONZ45_g1605 [Pleurotus djamor]|nr:hypothetical protein ONZ45_g1605 [Pleurotus djamor]
MVQVASVATDAIALIVVFIHCLRIRTTQGPLGRLFIQQGITGFLVMLALNIVSAVTFLSPDHSLTFGVVYPLMFPNIIACRLCVVCPLLTSSWLLTLLLCGIASYNFVGKSPLPKPSNSVDNPSSSVTQLLILIRILLFYHNIAFTSIVTITTTRTTTPSLHTRTRTNNIHTNTRSNINITSINHSR